MIYPINHLPDSIPIGIQTEQGVELIGFDLKSWLDAFPGMSFQVCHTRPGENEAYPVNDFAMVGTVLYWHPDGYDTAVAGEGKVEIVGVGDNRRKLSGFVPTFVTATSLGANKEPGENVAPWYEAVLQAAHDVKADVDVGKSGLFLVRAVGPEEYAPTTDRTIDEIRAAVAEGKTVFAIDKEGIVYAYAGDYGESANDEPCPKFFGHVKYSYGKLQYSGAEIRADNRLNRIGNVGMKTPAPYALNISGKTYDGSKDVSIEIPAVPDDAFKLFVVSVTPTETGWISDCSRSDIDSAQAAGKVCLMHFPGSGEVMMYHGRYKFASNAYSNNASAPGMYFDWAVVNDDKTVDKYGGGPLTANPGAVPSSKGICYQRWNGIKWEAATIAQLKADLGL